MRYKILRCTDYNERKACLTHVESKVSIFRTSRIIGTRIYVLIVERHLYSTQKKCYILALGRQAMINRPYANRDCFVTILVSIKLSYVHNYVRLQTHASETWIEIKQKTIIKNKMWTLMLIDDVSRSAYAACGQNSQTFKWTDLGTNVFLKNALSKVIYLEFWIELWLEGQTLPRRWQLATFTRFPSHHLANSSKLMMIPDFLLLRCGLGRQSLLPKDCGHLFDWRSAAAGLQFLYLWRANA